MVGRGSKHLAGIMESVIDPCATKIMSTVSSWFFFSSSSILLFRKSNMSESFLKVPDSEFSLSHCRTVLSLQFSVASFINLFLSAELLGLSGRHAAFLFALLLEKNKEGRLASADSFDWISVILKKTEPLSV